MRTGQLYFIVILYSFYLSIFTISKTKFVRLTAANICLNDDSHRLTLDQAVVIRRRD